MSCVKKFSLNSAAKSSFQLINFLQVRNLYALTATRIVVTAKDKLAFEVKKIFEHRF